MSNERTLVIIPTYNERENLPTVIARVAEHLPEINILVVDDDSPDGTGALADWLAQNNSRLQVLHRARKEGLGPAYIAGFKRAIAQGYTYIIEMDADGSHPASALPGMLAAIRDDTSGTVGGVIGSRWVRGGSVVNWSTSRELISRGGSFYARLMLRIPVRDVTAGFRVYRVDVLQSLGLDSVASQGYCFQIDLTRRVLALGWKIVEVPIEFRERELGESKMSRAIVLEAMLKVTQWGFQRIGGRPPSRAERR